MARPKPRSKRAQRRRRAKPLSRPLNPLRTGMAVQDSITGVEEFTSGKKVLRIIHTTERDAYDPAPSQAAPKKSAKRRKKQKEK